MAMMSNSWVGWIVVLLVARDSIGSDEPLVKWCELVPREEISQLTGKTVDVWTTRHGSPAMYDFRIDVVDATGLGGRAADVDGQGRRIAFSEILFVTIHDNDQSRSRNLSWVRSPLLRRLIGKNVRIAPTSEISRRTDRERDRVLQAVDRERLEEAFLGSAPRRDPGVPDVAILFDLNDVLTVVPKPDDDSKVTEKDLRPYKLRILESLLKSVSGAGLRGIAEAETAAGTARNRFGFDTDISSTALSRERLLTARDALQRGKLGEADPSLDKLLAVQAHKLWQEDKEAASHLLPFMRKELARRMAVMNAQLRIIRDRGERGILLAELDRLELAKSALEDGTLADKDPELYRVLTEFAESAARGAVDQRKRRERSGK